MGPLISINFLIPIALVTIILIVLLWYLFAKNKIFSRKLTFEKNKFLAYQKQVEFLKNSRQSPEQDFERLNQTARNFFKEYYNMGYNLTYLELAKRFKKQNKIEHARFCKLMADLKYTGQQIPAQQIKSLVFIFSKIIQMS